MPMTEDELDKILRNIRRFEPASSDLTDRIIYSVHTSVKPPSISVAGMLRELLSFVLPQPTYALVATLAIGLIAGVYTPMPIPATSASDTILQAYSADEGTIL